MFHRGLGTLSLADAITKQENVNPALNNPGALTYAPSYFCQLGIVNGLVQFCTLADGEAALNNQIRINTDRGLNLQTFFGGSSDYAGYAPASAGNDPATYASNVANWMGIDPSTPLASLDPTYLYGSGDVIPVAGNTLVGDATSILQSAGLNLDLTSGMTSTQIFVAIIAAGLGLLLLRKLF